MAFGESLLLKKSGFDNINLAEIKNYFMEYIHHSSIKDFQ